jgi:hypothetical protein
MSRGMGQLQRGVLRVLRQRGGHASLPEFAAELLSEPTKRSGLVSLRRSIHLLERESHVRVGYVPLVDETGTARGVGLHVWLERQLRRDFAVLDAVRRTRAPRRWASKDHLALNTLGKLTQEDIDKWLARTRTAKGYGPRRGRSWNPPPADPPWIPYQMAVRRMEDRTAPIKRLAFNEADGRAICSSRTCRDS